MVYIFYYLQLYQLNHLLLHHNGMKNQHYESIKRVLIKEERRKKEYKKGKIKKKNI